MSLRHQAFRQYRNPGSDGHPADAHLHALCRRPARICRDHSALTDSPLTVDLHPGQSVERRLHLGKRGAAEGTWQGRYERVANGPTDRCAATQAKLGEGEPADCARVSRKVHRTAETGRKSAGNGSPERCPANPSTGGQETVG